MHTIVEADGIRQLQSDQAGVLGHHGRLQKVNARVLGASQDKKDVYGGRQHNNIGHIFRIVSSGNVPMHNGSSVPG